MEVCVQYIYLISITKTPNVGLSILSMTLSVIQFLLHIRSDIPMIYQFEWCTFLESVSHVVSYNFYALSTTSSRNFYRFLH